MGKDGFRSPVDGLALPWLAGEAVRRAWTSHHVAEAFGDLAPLVDAYGAVADWRPGLSARVLWPLLAELLDEPVAELTSPPPRPGEDEERVWCAADPQAVRDESAALVELLAQGYAYLTHLATHRVSRAAPAAA